MTVGLLGTPGRLERADDRTGFLSGADDLDEWFTRYAWQNQQAGNAVTYVATVDDEIVGFYALCVAGVSREHVPAVFGRGRPGVIPCILLARLAVDRRAQGRGLGAALFRDAIARAVSSSTAIGAAALLVHARDDDARNFYLHHADLLESPLAPLQLVLPMKVAGTLLG